MDFITKSHDIALHGTYPGARSIGELLRNGLVILDKWPGPASRDVASTVKRILGINKAGHSGTLV